MPLLITYSNYWPTDHDMFDIYPTARVQDVFVLLTILASEDPTSISLASNRL